MQGKMLILTSIKLDEVCDLASCQVNANCVISLNEGIRITNGASIVGYKVRDSLGANEEFLHLAQLVLETQKRIMV